MSLVSSETSGTVASQVRIRIIFQDTDDSDDDGDDDNNDNVNGDYGSDDDGYDGDDVDDGDIGDDGDRTLETRVAQPHHNSLIIIIC